MHASSDKAGSAPIPNGRGAAAILSAGVGAFLVGLFAILADQSASIKEADWSALRSDCIRHICVARRLGDFACALAQSGRGTGAHQRRGSFAARLEPADDVSAAGRSFLKRRSTVILEVAECRKMRMLRWS